MGCQSFRTQVISYTGHFVPTLVISYLLFWSFRTYFLVISYPVTTISYPGHFVPILVISYLVQLDTKWLYDSQFVPKSFRTPFGHFVPILVIWWIDGWMNWRTDGRGLKWQINVLLKLLKSEILCHVWNPLTIAKPFCRRLQTCQKKKRKKKKKKRKKKRNS